jgi:hypothetical protein
LFGNTGLHLNLTFIENVKQDSFHPGAVAGGFTNNLTAVQTSAANDLLVIIGGQQAGGATSRVYTPQSILLDTEGDDWFSQTLIARNTTAGSGNVSVNLFNALVGGNSILLTTAVKRLK